jgi:anti-sigma regulatory factor (Ser/Thr protein kinase)
MSLPVPSDQFRHEALLYSGWADFISGTVPFIRGGLEAGEPVLVVESRAKIDMIRVALDRDADRVLFADMADVGANPARIIPAWHDFVAREGAAGKRLRGIGEPIWSGRTTDELVECQRHESLLNVAFGHGPAWWLLCPYDTENLDPAVIDEARRSHEFVSEAGKAWLSPDFRGIDASGAPFDRPLPEPGSRVEEMNFAMDDLGAVRRLVGQAATAAGLGGRRSRDLVTAVNEVATNSLRHGGGTGTIRVWHDLAKVTCEVRDAGRYDRPLGDRLRPVADASAPSGLWVANQLCDLVQIRTFPDGTVVRVHMDRHPKPDLKVLSQPTTSD